MLVLTSIGVDYSSTTKTVLRVHHAISYAAVASDLLATLIFMYSPT
jgi:hypothetical protein